MSTPSETQTQTAASQQQFIAPDVNIFESTVSYTLEAEMPGVSKSGLTLTVAENELTIVGQRETVIPAGTVLHRESEPAAYRRSFRLDPEIDPEKISASLDQGLLTITLPKAEKTKPRSITVS